MHRSPHRFTQGERDEIRKKMRAAFYVDDAAWKSKVLHYFEQAVTALVRGMLDKTDNASPG